MCIIADEVESVKATHILVAKSGPNQQLTVYSNKVATNVDNVMLLPVPSDEVEFLDFTGYTDIFVKLQTLFRRRNTFGMEMYGDSNDNYRSLKVHKVGSYLASFAKNLGELEHIDKKVFSTLNLQLLELMHKYYKPTEIVPNFGFIICKLNKGPQYEYHPFAYRHKMYNDNTLFIPTRHVHIHNNNFVNKIDREEEHWDHKIYAYNAKEISTMNKISGSTKLERCTQNIELVEKTPATLLKDYFFYEDELPTMPVLIDVKNIYRVEIWGTFTNDDMLATLPTRKPWFNIW